jgi:hypothetical protein
MSTCWTPVAHADDLLWHGGFLAANDLGNLHFRTGEQPDNKGGEEISDYIDIASKLH